jgi:hypothetical protein
MLPCASSIKGEALSPDKSREWSPNPLVRSGNYRAFDLAPDGKRILTIPALEVESGSDKSNVQVTVLLNFFDELKRRVPVNR